RSVEVRERDFVVEYEQDGQAHSVTAEHVRSTIPINLLARGLKPPVPAGILQAAQQIDYRAMILIYLVFERERFSQYDVFYFPEENLPITRLSEPKNFSDGYGPSNRTAICAELPCSPDSLEWKQSDEELAKLVHKTLEAVNIPLPAPVTKV